MIRIDLHMHSTFSDGTRSPEELVALGKRFRLSVMSLTDHDTAAGVPRFVRACRREGMPCLAGVELSAEFPRTMHILGYNFDFASPSFEAVLKGLQDGRDQRNTAILEALNNQGCSLSLEDVQAQAGDGVIGRPHFARALVAKGFVENAGEAFEKYLARGRSAYVPRKRLSPEGSIQAIRDHGGVAVLAHPVQMKLEAEELEKVLRRLKDAGLWGVESCYFAHTPEEKALYLGLAKKLGLYSTGGSDYHGANRPESSVGVPFEETLFPWARMGISL